MKQPEIVSASESDKLDFLNIILSSDQVWDYQDELVALAKDGSPEVRGQALHAFWHLPDPRHLDLLLEAAGSDPDISVRRSAISALGRFVHEGYVLEELPEEDFAEIERFLLNLHQNPEEPLDVRRTALEALSFITDGPIEDLVRAAYASPEQPMRISAVFSMGRSGTRTWDEILMKEMRSSDPEMRFEAVRAAGESFMQEAAETLERLTQDPDRDIRLAAITALGKANRPQSRAVLEKLSSSPDEDIRDAAEEALEEMDVFENIPMEDGEGNEDL